MNDDKPTDADRAGDFTAAISELTEKWSRETPKQFAARKRVILAVKELIAAVRADERGE